MSKAKVATAKDVELNRWCIEMAMHWPVVTIHYGYGAAQAGLPYEQNIQRFDADADVLGRANKIRGWVTSSR